MKYFNIIIRDFKNSRYELDANQYYEHLRTNNLKPIELPVETDLSIQDDQYQQEFRYLPCRERLNKDILKQNIQIPAVQALSDTYRRDIYFPLYRVNIYEALNKGDQRFQPVVIIRHISENNLSEINEVGLRIYLNALRGDSERQFREKGNTHKHHFPMPKTYLMPMNVLTGYAATPIVGFVTFTELRGARIFIDKMTRQVGNQGPSFTLLKHVSYYSNEFSRAQIKYLREELIRMRPQLKFESQVKFHVNWNYNISGLVSPPQTIRDDQIVLQLGVPTLLPPGPPPNNIIRQHTTSTSQPQLSEHPWGHQPVMRISEPGQLVRGVIGPAQPFRALPPHLGQREAERNLEHQRNEEIHHLLVEQFSYGWSYSLNQPKAASKVIEQLIDEQNDLYESRGCKYSVLEAQMEGLKQEQQRKKEKAQSLEKSTISETQRRDVQIEITNNVYKDQKESSQQSKSQSQKYFDDDLDENSQSNGWGTWTNPQGKRNSGASSQQRGPSQRTKRIDYDPDRPTPDLKDWYDTPEALEQIKNKMNQRGNRQPNQQTPFQQNQIRQWRPELIFSKEERIAHYEKQKEKDYQRTREFMRKAGVKSTVNVLGVSKPDEVSENARVIKPPNHPDRIRERQERWARDTEQRRQQQEHQKRQEEEQRAKQNEATVSDKQVKPVNRWGRPIQYTDLSEKEQRKISNMRKFHINVYELLDKEVKEEEERKKNQVKSRDDSVPHLLMDRPVLGRTTSLGTRLRDTVIGNVMKAAQRHLDRKAVHWQRTWEAQCRNEDSSQPPLSVDEWIPRQKSGEIQVENTGPQPVYSKHGINKLLGRYKEQQIFLLNFPQCFEFYEELYKHRRKQINIYSTELGASQTAKDIEFKVITEFGPVLENFNPVLQEFEHLAGNHCLFQFEALLTVPWSETLAALREHRAGFIGQDNHNVGNTEYITIIQGVLLHDYYHKYTIPPKKLCQYMLELYNFSQFPQLPSPPQQREILRGFDNDFTSGMIEMRRIYSKLNYERVTGILDEVRDLTTDGIVAGNPDIGIIGQVMDKLYREHSRVVGQTDHSKPSDYDQYLAQLEFIRKIVQRPECYDGRFQRKMHGQNVILSFTRPYPRDQFARIISETTHYLIEPLELVSKLLIESSLNYKSNQNQFLRNFNQFEMEYIYFQCLKVMKGFKDVAGLEDPDIALSDTNQMILDRYSAVELAQMAAQIPDSQLQDYKAGKTSLPWENMLVSYQSRKKKISQGGEYIRDYWSEVPDMRTSVYVQNVFGNDEIPHEAVEILRNSPFMGHSHRIKPAITVVQDIMVARTGNVERIDSTYFKNYTKQMEELPKDAEIPFWAKDGFKETVCQYTPPWSIMIVWLEYFIRTGRLDLIDITWYRMGDPTTPTPTKDWNQQTDTQINLAVYNYLKRQISDNYKIVKIPKPVSDMGYSETRVLGKDDDIIDYFRKGAFPLYNPSYILHPPQICQHLDDPDNCPGHHNLLTKPIVERALPKPNFPTPIQEGTSSQPITENKEVQLESQRVQNKEVQTPEPTQELSDIDVDKQISDTMFKVLQRKILNAQKQKILPWKLNLPRQVWDTKGYSIAKQFGLKEGWADLQFQAIRKLNPYQPPVNTNPESPESTNKLPLVEMRKRNEKLGEYLTVGHELIVEQQSLIEYNQWKQSQPPDAPSTSQKQTSQIQELSLSKEDPQTISDTSEDMQSVITVQETPAKTQYDSPGPYVESENSSLGNEKKRMSDTKQDKPESSSPKIYSESTDTTVDQRNDNTIDQ